MESNQKNKEEKGNFLFKSRQSSWETYYKQEANCF